MSLFNICQYSPNIAKYRPSPRREISLKVEVYHPSITPLEKNKQSTIENNKKNTEMNNKLETALISVLKISYHLLLSPWCEV